MVAVAVAVVVVVVVVVNCNFVVLSILFKNAHVNCYLCVLCVYLCDTSDI